MHRAVLLAQGEFLEMDDVFMGQTSASSVQDSESEKISLVGKTMAEVERNLILNTLDHCLGNRTHAANILGISIRTLRNKLKIYTDDGEVIQAPAQGYKAAV